MESEVVESGQTSESGDRGAVEGLGDGIPVVEAAISRVRTNSRRN